MSAKPKTISIESAEHVGEHKLHLFFPTEKSKLWILARSWKTHFIPRSKSFWVQKISSDSSSMVANSCGVILIWSFQLWISTRINWIKENHSSANPDFIHEPGKLYWFVWIILGLMLVTVFLKNSAFIRESFRVLVTPDIMMNAAIRKMLHIPR